MPETNFFWDPLSDNIHQERDAIGALTAEYTTEPGLYGNVISRNRGGVESQFHFDALGSTLALTDDNQQVTDTRAYSAFGDTTESTGSTTVPFQYVGQKGYYYELLTKACLVRTRAFVSAAARWSSLDRLFILRRPNRFVYSDNSPTTRRDPSGLFTIVAGDELPKIDPAEKAALAKNCKCEVTEFTGAQKKILEAQSLGYVRCIGGKPEAVFVDPREVIGIDAELYDKCELKTCIQLHEYYHVAQFLAVCADICKDYTDKGKCVIPSFQGIVGTLRCVDAAECFPHAKEIACWAAKYREFQKKGADRSDLDRLETKCLFQVEFMIFNALSSLIQADCKPEFDKETQAVLAEVSEIWGIPERKPKKGPRPR